jgi:predicted nucleic acid-binding protein
MADGLIGATAVVHALTVVTRNVDDLRATGAAVLNPWSDV